MISQRLSLNMPKPSQNQQIQTLTILVRGDNVFNVIRTFSCHRNTIIRLRQGFQQTGGVADCRRPRVTIPQMDMFIILTHLRWRFQMATNSARQYGISKQCCAASGKPGNPLGQRGHMWDKCLQHVIWLPVCSGYNGISVGGDSSGLGFYFLMSLGLTLVIMAVEFEFLKERGNVLLIIVSLRGTNLKVGVLWYGVAIWAVGKQISLLCKATLMLKVTFTRFCSLKLFLSFKGMGLQLLMHDNARPHVARICRQFLNRNNVNILPWPAVSPDMNPIEHIWDYLGRKVRARGNIHNLRDLENALIQEFKITLPKSLSDVT